MAYPLGADRDSRRLADPSDAAASRSFDIGRVAALQHFSKDGVGVVCAFVGKVELSFTQTSTMILAPSDC